jgi:hypothetical protein
MSEVLTFEKIYECYRKNDFPENYEDLIEKWLDIKAKNAERLHFSDGEYVRDWITEVVIVLEILKRMDVTRWEKHLKFWKNLIKRDWVVNFNENGVEVIWK